jgi:hypothetical protein
MSKLGMNDYLLAGVCWQGRFISGLLHSCLSVPVDFIGTNCMLVSNAASLGLYVSISFDMQTSLLIHEFDCLGFLFAYVH